MDENTGSVEVEWAIHWDDEPGGVVNYGPGDDGRAAALKVAPIYGYGTAGSRVSLVHRTVTYGPWTADAEAEHG